MLAQVVGVIACGVSKIEVAVTASAGADDVPELCGGKKEELHASAVSSKHEIGIVPVDEIALIHDADARKDIAMDENATGRCELDLLRLFKLAGVAKALCVMYGAFAEKMLKAPTGAPDGLGGVIEVHNRRSHVAMLGLYAGDELCEELRAEVDVIVQKKDELAAGLQGGADALIVGSGDAVVVRIFNADGTYIGRHLYLTALDNISIGANCVLSDHVYITDLAHGLDPHGAFILHQPLESKGPVTIGDGCFIGFRAAILPGVTLGAHCVVGVNAVVTRSFPAYTMLAGVPARAIKTYSHERNQWITIEEQA